MREIILENVRSFAGEHKIPIAPLTILTGENSSGKSTFLACNAIVNDPVGFPLYPGFNEAPYNLGGYDTIATFKGGAYGRAKHFRLGAEIGKNTSAHVKYLATYKNLDGRPDLNQFLLQRGEASLDVAFEKQPNSKIIAKLEYINGKEKLNLEFEFIRPFNETRRSMIDILFSSMYRGTGKSGPSEIVVKNINRIFYLFSGLDSGGSLSLAPVRTKPERIYNQISEVFDPAGNHIPLILDNYLSSNSSTRERREISGALERFGKESGMFTKVKVRRIGDRATDPFQILVTVAGRPASLMDVGYGVSQALPVIVQSVLSNAPRLMLMQQPEVHLHPKAQAALGTFFSDLVQNRKKHLVIETHSDFIIDRIRQEVASGKISPDNIVILYFGKNKIETKIHPIRIDSNGNLLNVPSSYREFFLEEEMRLLRRSSKPNS